LSRGVVVAGYWPIALLVVVGAVAVALLVLFATRGGKGREGEETPSVEGGGEAGWPLREGRTVSPEDVKRAQEELRVLEIEREVLSQAIRRLYEAQAEGKISEDERDRLVARYRERMTEVKETIARSGSVVALHELEEMRGDLVKLFTDRFDDLNRKIEELRTQLEVKPVEEPVPSPAPPPPTPQGEEERERRRRPSAPRRTEAEERVEKIREEVEKVLEKLGQIEAGA